MGHGIPTPKYIMGTNFEDLGETGFISSWLSSPTKILCLQTIWPITAKIFNQNYSSWTVDNLCRWYLPQVFEWYIHQDRQAITKYKAKHKHTIYVHLAFSSGVKSASDWSLKTEPEGIIGTSEGIIGTGFCRPDAYVIQTTMSKQRMETETKSISK